MSRILNYLLAIWLLGSCTTEITVDLPQPSEEIVVEGYIDIGTAPSIFLTRNSPYFGDFDLNDLDQYLVDSAIVIVTNGVLTDTLVEDCFTFMDSSRTLRVCEYRAENPTIFGEENTIYEIKVWAEGKFLSAKTKIPGRVNVDTLWTEPHPRAEYDSLVRLIAVLNEPDTLGNYYRLFTKRNSEPFYVAGIFDDRLFNGQDYKAWVQRGNDPDDDFNFETYFYFRKGDTVITRLASINRAHYDFWNSLSADGGGSPFSSATVIKTNIMGGLGIWGGYASEYDTIYISQ